MTQLKIKITKLLFLLLIIGMAIATFDGKCAESYSLDADLPCAVVAYASSTKSRGAINSFNLLPKKNVVLWFDKSVLAAVGEHEIQSAALELTVKEFIGSRKNDLEIAVFAHPNENFSDQPERAQAETPTTFLGKANLGGDVVEKSPILIKLSIGSLAFAQALKEGFVLSLNSSGHGNVAAFYGSANTRRPVLHLVLKLPHKPQMLDLRLTVKPEDGHYVTQESGEFMYKGSPIRFWGDNLSALFDSYEKIDAAAKRLRNMGFNAVRLWAPGGPGVLPFYTPESAKKKQMLRSERGDGSWLDLYDYMVSRCKAEGLFIYNPNLGYFHAKKMLQDWPNLSVKIPDTMTHWDYEVLPYISDEFLEVRLAHIRNYLNHINPYTGKRNAEEETFALWQLTNENQTVPRILDGNFRKWPADFQQILHKKWNIWLHAKYGTRERLESAWGKLDEGEDPEKGSVKPAPIYSEVSGYPEKRGKDFVTFVEECFIVASKKMEKAAREMAPPGVGIAVAPITANANNNFTLHAHYASSCLDFNTTVSYSKHYTSDRDQPRHPWRPIVSDRPFFYMSNLQKLKDKPLVVYEYSFIRPYEYRVETSPSLTFMLAGNGLNGSFMFYFGDPNRIGDKRWSGLSFLTEALPNPVNTTSQAVSDGMVHAGDEIVLASSLITGQAFLNGIPTNRESTTITFGKDALRNPLYKLYVDEAASPLPNVDLATGIPREFYTFPKFYQRLLNTSIRRRLQLRFDPQQNEAMKVEGALFDLDGNEALAPSNGILWDKPGEKIVLDTAKSKVVVGFIKSGFEFKDGIKLGPLNREFALFGVASRDGQRLTKSSDIIMVLVSTAENSDFVLDPAKIKGDTFGNIQATTNPGRLPVKVDRCEAKILLPGIQGVATRYNFAGFAYKTEPIDGEISISKDEPLFVLRIRR